MESMPALLALSQRFVYGSCRADNDCQTAIGKCFCRTARRLIIHRNAIKMKNSPEPVLGVDYISSVANPFVKHLVKLRRSSSYRHSNGSVLVVGSTCLREISEYLQQKLSEPVIDYLFVKDGADMPSGLRGSSCCIVHVNDRVMQKLAGIEESESTDAVGVLKLPKSFLELKSSEVQVGFQIFPSELHRLLVLEGIQDPGNVGTLIRTAAAFQWDGVFLLPGCCDPFNEKALRASRGACFQLPIAKGLWNHLEILKDFYRLQMYAAHPGSNKGHYSDSDAVRISSCSSSTEENILGYKNQVALLSNEFANAVAGSSLCLILGSEGKGLSKQARSSCQLVAIPMPGGFESLNVSIAGGIFLFLLQKIL